MTNVAKKLGCDWHTAKRYVKLHKLDEMLEAEDERLNDITEMKLMDNINKNDTTAIIFRLKTRAKHRGYVEQFNYSDVTPPELKHESEEQIKQRIKAVAAAILDG